MEFWYVAYKYKKPYEDSRRFRRWFLTKELADKWVEQEEQYPSKYKSVWDKERPLPIKYDVTQQEVAVMLGCLWYRDEVLIG